jgi:hypothetical protein|tara:strand:+ start:250 stop:699 length:450 start_codon:yes stop_codon:yes gene_type:complete
MKTTLITLLISSMFLQTSSSTSENIWKNKLTHSLDFKSITKEEKTQKFILFTYKNMKYSHLSDWETISFVTKKEIEQFRSDVQEAIPKRGNPTKLNWERDKYTLSIGGSGLSKWNLWITAKSGKYTAIGKPKVLRNLSTALNLAVSKMD